MRRCTINLVDQDLGLIRSHPSSRRRGGGKRIADFGREYVGCEIDIVGKATEQMGRLIAFGAPAVVGALPAKALVVAAAVGAPPTAESAFQDHAITFFDFMNLRRVSSEFFDARKYFMAEDDGIRHL